MASSPAVAVTEVEEVVVGPVPAAAGRATDWGAIIGGALGAIAVSIILFTAGSGFGLSTVQPWSFANRAPETFAIGAAIWLIVMQWLSSAFGGYLAGRLRAKWIGPRTDEVLFRDTAHGLLAWALATVIVAALFTTLGTSAAVVATEGAPGAADAAQAAARSAKRRGKRPPISPSSRRFRSWSAPSSVRWPEGLGVMIAMRLSRFPVTKGGNNE